jgi:hypothetical protein
VWSAGPGPYQGAGPGPHQDRDPNLEKTQVQPSTGAPGPFPRQDQYGAAPQDPSRGSPFPQQYETQQYGQAPSGATPYGQQSSWGADPFDQRYQESDPLGVPRRGESTGDGSSGGPNRTIIITALVLTILIALGAGAFFGLFRSDSSETAATTDPSASAATTDGSTAPQTSAAPSTSTAKETTREPDPQAPTGFVSDPWSRGDMDFGLITAISPQGAGAVITVDRAEFLMGNDAASYYAEHPELEPLDYAVVNESTSTLQFLVTEDALLYSQYLLGDGNTVRTSRISMDQFLDRGQDVVSTGQPINVWLYHTSGEDGPVVYLAEQFVP